MPVLVLLLLFELSPCGGMGSGLAPVQAVIATVGKIRKEEGNALFFQRVTREGAFDSTTGDHGLYLCSLGGHTYRRAIHSGANRFLIAGYGAPGKGSEYRMVLMEVR